MKFHRPILAFSMFVTVLITLPLLSQNPSEQSDAKGQAKKQKKRKTAPQMLPTTNPFAELDRPEHHEDFPAMCLNEEGEPIVVYIQNDGTRDVLKLASLNDASQLQNYATLTAPEITNIYQPCITRLANGRSYCVWSQLEADGQWQLAGCTIGRKGRARIGDIVTITDSPGNDIFPDLGTDREGRVWLVWQRLNNGVNQIVGKYQPAESKDWSEEIMITKGEGGGDWEPRLAFGANSPWVVFDSYRNGDFDIYLTQVSAEGNLSDVIEIARSDRYEARAEAAASPDGKTLWITYEDGITHWGKDLGAEWRKKGGGLHHDRQLKVVKVDLNTIEVEKVADITPILPDLVANPTSVGTGAIDVPEIIVDSDGHPWVFFRYCLFSSKGFWQLAYSRMNLETQAWSKPELLGKSQFCLDRRCHVALHPKNGSITVAYPSDLRTSKQAGDSGIYLASIDPKTERPEIGALPFDLDKVAKSALRPYNNTPERDRDDHHTWETGARKYQLVWGDVHRHTDFSNCRTTDDGCITEHYRYAIEAGGLDFLGTSDHTDIGKTYSAYEWWQTQKMADLFHNPGSFVSLYAYEREQKLPYGHRNVLFEERGGPIIYIKRSKYSASPWATPLPKQAGALIGDITPQQLWDLLRLHGKRAITIEHTSAGSMGTDWSQYEKLDNEFENILEVFQGSRNSSEGVGTPQPPIVVGGPRVSKFPKKSAKGTWQNALRLKHRLGAFASSDHRSTNVSYGGVYVSEFTRKGLFDAMDARRTVAATDKIYMQFSCNGHLMGEAFETSKKPTFAITIEGTAPISRVTLIRNEQDYQVFTPETAAKKFTRDFTDETPEVGENRYYVRVEQNDGNMGWTSPVWVKFE